MDDAQLLREYAERQSEAAFAELLGRHLNLVYSTALRRVGDAHLAQDVVQTVFIELARKPRSIRDPGTLAVWLYRAAGHAASNILRSETRRRQRETEAMEMNGKDDTHSVWQRLAPYLEEAIDALSTSDQNAVVLRFFEGKSLREVGQALSMTEDAAQKRVSRALDKMRLHFVQRGVTVSGAAMATALAAHSVQAAPVGLAATVQAATALVGSSSLAHLAIGTATKAIAMTTLQKTALTATLIVTTSTAIYEGRQAFRLHDEVRTLESQQASLTRQVQQFQAQREAGESQVAGLQQENERLRQAAAEVTRLRAEVAQLRVAAKSAQDKTTVQASNDLFSQSVLALTAKAGELNQYLQRMPDKRIPELQFLTENHWLDAARDADLQSEVGVRKALAKLRSLAKNYFGSQLSGALDAYIEANQGQLPPDPSELKSYFSTPVDASMLQRYEMLHSGRVEDLPKDAWVISEKRPVDRDYDSHLYVAPKGRSGSWGTGLNASGDPDPNWATR